MNVILFLTTIAGGFAALYFYTNQRKTIREFEKFKKEELQKAAQEIIKKKFSEKEKEAEEIKTHATNLYKKVKSQIEEEQKILRNEENKLKSEKTQMLAQKRRYEKLLANVENLKNELADKIKKAAGISKEEAKKEYLLAFEDEINEYKATKIKAAAKEIELKKDELAQDLILSAMQSIIVDVVDEATVSRIEIKDESIKGKIIGKDGRNIRSFESAAGVELIVDEAPNIIGISSFDSVRREIAKIALENLIKDGRIHPGAIEEHIEKAKKLMEKELIKTGMELATMINWMDIPKEILPLLGRLKYRRSKGQSQYIHTLEVIKAGEYIARELGANVGLVQKACLLHDIGKVLSHKIKKPHHRISGDIARKYNLDPKLVNAIEAHHGDIEPQSLEASIVTVADAISGARPGARQESLDEYIERVEALENKAFEITGNKAQDIYALSAGRELRVIVKPNEVDDNAAVVMARDIAKAIEESGIFPGNVDVIVIRELRTHAQSGRG